MVGSSNWETLRFIIVVAGISGATGQCTSTNTLAPIDHKACQPFDYRNITTNKAEFCTLACVKINYCGATIYDKTSGVCMLVNEPCFSLASYPDHVYRSFTPGCTKWVPHHENHLAYWYIEGNTLRSYVSRKIHESNIIIGKTTSMFFATDPTSGADIIGGDCELLLVEPSCSVTWAAHDTTKCQPVPKGALVGGKLTATNTPLYVARMVYDGLLLGGYYNPLNGKAWMSFAGPKSNTIFELMVVNEWLISGQPHRHVVCASGSVLHLHDNLKIDTLRNVV